MQIYVRATLQGLKRLGYQDRGSGAPATALYEQLMAWAEHMSKKDHLMDEPKKVVQTLVSMSVAEPPIVFFGGCRRRMPRSLDGIAEG